MDWTISVNISSEVAAALAVLGMACLLVVAKYLP